MEKAGPTARRASAQVIDTAGLQQLIETLRADQYTVVAPVLGDGAIVYDEIAGLNDLPVGWTDEQEAGRYRLKRRSDGAVFGYNLGPQSWKRFFTPERVRLWRAQRSGDGAGQSIEIVAETAPQKRYALLGVRSCELHAMAIQDRVYGKVQGGDPVYAPRRRGVFTVAVNCGQAGNTCFCVSMQTGPEAQAGYDLVMTEIVEAGDHRFLLEAGTEAGQELLERLPGRDVAEADRAAAAQAIQTARAQMGRQLDTKNLKDVLQSSAEHPHWQDVADRCLSCANCTMVCPTCFCSSVEDRSELDGDHAERWRRWDSCFTMDFSYLHGGSVRSSPVSRYRQWMTHKLANWVDQFDESGCVGCGRCITWCPVGIDLTEEAQALRQPADGARPPAGKTGDAT